MSKTGRYLECLQIILKTKNHFYKYMIQLKQLNYSTEKRHGEQFIGMCTQSDPGLDPGSNFTC